MKLDCGASNFNDHNGILCHNMRLCHSCGNPIVEEGLNKWSWNDDGNMFSQRNDEDFVMFHSLHHKDTDSEIKIYKPES